MILSDTNPKIGVALRRIESRMIFRANGGFTSVQEGDCLMLQFARSDADITSLIEGGENSMFANLTHPLSVANGAPVPFGMLCIALEPIADNQSGMVRWQGLVDRCAIGGVGQAGGTVLNADRLYARGVRAELTSTSVIASTGGKIVGIAMAAQTTATSTRDIKPVLFSGLIGFGTAT